MQYDRTKLLGKGVSAFVFLGTFNHQEVAVKRILKQYNSDKEDDRTTRREEEAMRKLSHPNVLQLIHVEEDADFKYMVLELCRGTVRDYIKGEYKDQMPTERDALMQMANGLHYIHSNGLVHRDIKPVNVLISQSFVLKISDFGCSKPVSSSGSFSTTSGPKGTRIYYSPEFLVLEEKDEEERRQIRANVSIDIFSLGCLFFSYLTKGGHPFASPERPFEMETLINIKSGNKFLKNGLHANHYALGMIDGMTQSIPSDRWRLEKVIETLNNVKQ